MKLSKMVKQVEKRLSRSRFIHSLAVAAEGVKLAQKFNLDSRKAFKAALLHDIAREMDAESLEKYLINYKKDLSLYRDPPVLMHSFVGEIIARDDFFISDLEVLEAIRYHTLGAVKMGPLAQIIFIADTFSRDRDFVTDNLREKAQSLSNLDQLTLLVVQSTKNYFISKGKSLHCDTDALLKDLEERVDEKNDSKMGS